MEISRLKSGKTALDACQDFARAYFCIVFVLAIYRYPLHF